MEPFKFVELMLDVCQVRQAMQHTQNLHSHSYIFSNSPIVRKKMQFIKTQYQKIFRRKYKMSI